MQRMRIAIVFDVKEDYGIHSDSLDYCDFMELSNVEFIKEQLEYEGYEVRLINPPTQFFEMVKDGGYKEHFDMVFNMSEGFRSRNREILVPILCETLNIPCIGTDAFGSVFTNHKFQTKLFAARLGINTADDFYFDYRIQSFQSVRDFFQEHISWFPVIVKPNREGTSMGLRKVHHVDELIAAINALIELYDQELIIEKYIDGPDVVSFIIGTDENAQVYPLVEITDEKGDSLNLWNTELKIHNAYYIGARIPEMTTKIIKEHALLLHKALRLYDISRIDWRVDKNGVPFLLESTPLPSLGSDFACCAKTAGLNPHQLIRKVVESAIWRAKKVCALFPEK